MEREIAFYSVYKKIKLLNASVSIINKKFKMEKHQHWFHLEKVPFKLNLIATLKKIAGQ
jgi:hypothetical protein